MLHLRAFLALAAALSFASPLAAKIVECSHFRELNNHIVDGTLIVLDIDDTLIVPVQTLGRDVWFGDRVKILQKCAASREEAFERAIGDWEAVRHLTQMQLVEEGTQNVIRDLQQRNIPVMGLTTQGLALATRTVQQLNGLGIDLDATSPSKEDHYFMNRIGVLYRKGILFTAGTDKGSAFLKFCDIVKICPKRVVYVNDKLSHLQDVEKSVDNGSIEFIGLRYGYSDAYVNGYRPDIADVQWRKSSFEHILSDEEASEMLKH